MGADNENEEQKLRRIVKSYILKHEEEISRRVDMIVLYIDSFRKLFVKNLSGINEGLVPHVTMGPGAVKNKEDFVKKYLYEIKDGFNKASNGILAVKQYFPLVNLNYSGIEGNVENHKKDMFNAALTTIHDLYGIGRALGKAYCRVTGFNDSRIVKEEALEFEDSSNLKDRHLIDIDLEDEDQGVIELAAAAYLKV